MNACFYDHYGSHNPGRSKEYSFGNGWGKFARSFLVSEVKSAKVCNPAQFQAGMSHIVNGSHFQSAGVVIVLLVSRIRKQYSEGRVIQITEVNKVVIDNVRYASR
jgi:hypothetical protein